ncbi:acyl carrier protein [Kineococcus xinjiangensis]|uniref:Acyl carrier protein n=1 Tax=Kineococcus xinjiangensis TaxID=512762 RepID=A0A2S6IDB8_9ACTN|nr:acyl carrier protein [Kineococcus xinjiangensis]PPK92201.1 acyl carrier protein [Kineococcus xinjiangensis]
MSTWDRLQHVVAEVLGDRHPPLTDGTTAPDVPGWGLAETISILCAVEDEFGVRFRDDQVEGVRTLGDLLRLLEEAGAG